MRKRRVLNPFAVAAGLAVLAFPAFAHSEGGSDRAGSIQATAAAQPVETEPSQLPGSGEMATTDRTGTTGPSRVQVDNGAVTLLGQVRNAHAKEQINAKVTALAGSHSVENALVIAQR